MKKKPRMYNSGRRFRFIWLLSIAIIIAAFLRLHHISKDSLWLDETASVYLASTSLERVIQGESTTPPLYYILLHFWIKLFGSSEAGVRSLSIIPGVMAVVLTYFLGKRLYDEKTGIVAACFMAISEYQIHFGQEARAYALLLAFLLGSMLAMDVALQRKERSFWPWVTYYAISVAALYTHFFSVFFIASQNVFFMLRWEENKKKVFPWIATQLLIVITFTPWMLQMLDTVGEYSVFRRYLFLRFPQTLFSFLGGETLIPMDEAAVKDMQATLLQHWYYVVLSVLGFGTVFIAALSSFPVYKRATCFTLTMCFGPMVMALLVSLKIPIFVDRYLIGASPMLILFMTAGAYYMFLSQIRRRKILIGGALIIIVTLTFLSLYRFYYHPRFGREQWREVVHYVEANGHKEDLVVFHVGFIKLPYDYYADRVTEPKGIQRLSLRRNVENEGIIDWAEALDTIRQHNRVWLVRSHLTSVTNPDNVLVRFQEMFPKQGPVAHFPKAKGITVYFMER